MCSLGEMVQAEGESLSLEVREKVDFGIVDLAQKSTSIVGTGELGIEQRYHCCFRTVADHLDRIEEMLSLGKEPGEAVRFGQLRNREVMRRVLALQLKCVQFLAQTVNALLLRPFLCS